MGMAKGTKRGINAVEIKLHPLGICKEIRYAHQGDKKKYSHPFKRKGETYHAVLGGRSFVMIEVPAMVTRNGHKYIGD